MQAVQEFIGAIKGKSLSAVEARELAYAIHEAMVDAPEMQWMDRSFEDMADTITNALDSMPEPSDDAPRNYAQFDAQSRYEVTA